MWSFRVNHHSVNSNRTVDRHGSVALRSAVSSSEANSRVFIPLLALVLAIQIVDAVATHSMVTVGMVTEANPFVSSLIHQGLFLPFKLVGLVISAGLLWLIWHRFQRIALTLMMGIVCFYALVLVWNVSTLL
jgi:hypothetical protein